MANEEILRLRTTVSTEEGMAQIRALGREIGLLPEKSKRPIEQIDKGFKGLTEGVKRFGEQLTKVIPGLEEFGLGAAGAVIAAGTLVKTLSNISGKIVELSYSSKELGMSVEQLKGWSLAAEKAGIAPQTLIQSLKSFRDVEQGFKYNMSGIRDQLVAMGAGPVVSRIMAARTETEKLKIAMDFKEVLLKQDQSGFAARQFLQSMGLDVNFLRLSFEEAQKAAEKFEPLSPEDAARAKKYKDGIIELGAKWDELLEKTAIGLFPMMQKELQNLDWIIGKLDTIGKWIDEHLPGKGDDFIGRLSGAITQPLLHPGGGGGAQRGGRPGWSAPHRALGGSVHSGLPYIVGEEGPEMFSPSTSGRIIPAGGGDRGDGVRIVKEGVFQALVDFKSYMEGSAGLMRANFGGSAGSAGGGGWGGGSGSGSGGSHQGGGNDGQSTAPSEASQMPATLPGGAEGTAAVAAGRNIPFGVAPAGNSLFPAESPGFAGIPLPKMPDASTSVPGGSPNTHGKTTLGKGDDPRGLEQFIRETAIKEGVDPDVALRVAKSEGLRQFGGDPVHGRATSFGALQLHTGGGLGDEFRKETGLDPSDPKNEKRTIEWALKKVKTTGWSPWHGARKVGVGQREGLPNGQNRRTVATASGGAPGVTPASRMAAGQGAFQGGKPNELIVHYTGGIQHFTGEQYARAITGGDPYMTKYHAQLFMDEHGNVTRVVPEGQTSWHAGPANPTGEGMEIATPYGGENPNLKGSGINAEQREALKKYYQNARRAGQYPGGVRGHSEVTPGHRENEGAFEAQELRRLDSAVAGNTGPVTGNVNVRVESNGTAAKTSASADGLWQKTTIDNYKQMQPTSRPSTLAASNSG